jgi:K+-transporting ATPase KdpF subunit
MRIAQRRHEIRVKAGLRSQPGTNFHADFMPWPAIARRVFTVVAGISASSLSDFSGAKMTFDLLLASLVALGLLVYLVAVLLRPERF